MLGRAISSPQFSEIDYVCVATDQLQKMLSDLEFMEANNRRLTLTLATAGHDLRQRLHALLGTVELLTSARDELRTGELNSRAKSMIFRLAGELEQLALQAEREYGRTRPAPYQFAISSLLEQLRTDWQAEASAKQLQFHVGQVDCMVESDRRLLAVIMNNLVGNAVKHTVHGRVAVESRIDGCSLLLAVADTGPGISEDDLYRSYAFSSRPAGLNEGMGLGLSIARKTAELLRHDFDITSAPGVGSCVRLRVPLVSP